VFRDPNSVTFVNDGYTKDYPTACRSFLFFYKNCFVSDYDCAPAKLMLPVAFQREMRKIEFCINSQTDFKK